MSTHPRRPRGRHRIPGPVTRFKAWWVAATDEFAESVGILPGDVAEDER